MVRLSLCTRVHRVPVKCIMLLQIAASRSITIISINIAELPERFKSADGIFSEIVMSKCASCDES